MKQLGGGLVVVVVGRGEQLLAGDLIDKKEAGDSSVHAAVDAHLSSSTA